MFRPPVVGIVINVVRTSNQVTDGAVPSVPQVFQGRLDSLAVATIKALTTVMLKSPAAKVSGATPPPRGGWGLARLPNKTDITYITLSPPRAPPPAGGVQGENRLQPPVRDHHLPGPAVAAPPQGADEHGRKTGLLSSGWQSSVG